MTEQRRVDPIVIHLAIDMDSLACVFKFKKGGTRFNIDVIPYILKYE
jgi:hypothetical protein